MNNPRLRATLFFVSAVVLGAAIFFIDPQRAPWLPKCAFYAITGMYCPGCGTTRALHHVLHGDFWGAFRFNILTMLMLPVMGYLIASEVSIITRKKPLPQIIIPPLLGWGVVGAIIVFWIARNIPIYPFTLLAPH